MRFALRVRSSAFLDDFLLSRCCGDDVGWFAADDHHYQSVAGQLLVTIAIIAAVTVSAIVDVHNTQSLSTFVPFNISNIFSAASRGKQNNGMREISVKKKYKELQAIYSNSRWWSTFSLDQFIYNQQQHKQLDVAVVQCNQHHRESHHQGSTHFKTLYRTIAIDSNQLLNVVDFNFTIIRNARIAQTKKILVESIIFAYLISLDLYS